MKMKEPKPRIAVLGLHHGYKCASDLMATGWGELAAVSGDTDLSRANAARLGIRLYEDYRELIDSVEVDGVIVTLPNHLHREAAERCAARGFHVLVEKPIASTLEDADRIAELGEKYGVKILVGHHRRFSPMLRRGRREVASGGLGRLVAVNAVWAALKPDDYFRAGWRTRAESGGGPLMINAVHTVDDIRFLTGQEIVEVHASASNRIRGFAVEDTAAATLVLDGGALATVLISDCVPSIWNYESNAGENPAVYHRPGHSYILFGAAGSLALPELRRVSYPEGNRSWANPAVEETLEASGLDPAERASDPGDPMTALLGHFCRVCLGQEIPMVAAADARESLRAVLAIKESAATGRPVKLR